MLFVLLLCVLESWTKLQINCGNVKTQTTFFVSHCCTSQRSKLGKKSFRYRCCALRQSSSPHWLRVPDKLQLLIQALRQSPECISSWWASSFLPVGFLIRSHRCSRDGREVFCLISFIYPRYLRLSLQLNGRGIQMVVSRPADGCHRRGPILSSPIHLIWSVIKTHQ